MGNWVSGGAIVRYREQRSKFKEEIPHDSILLSSAIVSYQW